MDTRHMDNRRKVVFFSVLACFSAAITAPLAADQTIAHVFLVLPLVAMGIFLFVAGYYAGLVRSER